MPEKQFPVKQLRLCGREITAFSIVLAQDAGAAEQFAAKELQSHIYEAAGALLPIAYDAKNAVYIGEAAKKDVSKIKYDGFVIETDDCSLYLYGAIPRGTVYAADGFLEKYIGCRKYAPGVQRVLESDGIDIPCRLYELQNPVFELRINDWIAHTGGQRFAVWERMNSATAGVTQEQGGAIEIYGFCHTFERLCDPKLYFERHPEYYSEIDGVRIPAGNVFDRPCAQLCLTNRDVLRIVTENTLKNIAEHPECTIFDISQNDNCGYCRCAACSASDEEEGSPSGTLLRFVNAVADEVKKVYPGVLLQTFAYQYTRKAPKITKPRDNVIVRLCSIEACFRHPLNDPDCKHNVREFANDMEDWRKISKKLSVWDYATNYDCYYAPFPNFEAVRENIRYFADCGAVHVFEEDTPGTYTGDLNPLQAYLIAKLLWNPYMSGEEYDYHIRDFLEGYFGAGWKHIRRYMEILHETTRDWHVRCFQPIDSIHADDYTEKVNAYVKAYQPARKENHYLTDFIARTDELNALWDAANALAANKEEKERLLRSRMSLSYLDLFCRGRDREKMTDAERGKYEADVARFFENKERFGQHINIHTSVINR